MSDLDACLLARFPGPRPPDWLRCWLDEGLGGVLLFAPNITSPAQLRTLTATLREHNPDVIIAADEEGGIVTRVEARRGSSYPGNAALGAAGDTGLTSRVAASMGAMLAAGGVSLDLAPSADLDADPRSPVTGVRSFGSDPQAVAAHTAAFVRGLQSAGVAACAKHFPGHGRTRADSHMTLPRVSATLAGLRASDMTPFRAAISAGVRAVMTAHVLYPLVDRRPATISPLFLNEILRGECGFGGVIVTDALGMAAIGDGDASAAGAVRALAAGADLLCLPEGQAAQRRARDALAAAVASGDIAARRVADAAARVRDLAAWTRPADSPDPPAPGGPAPDWPAPDWPAPGPGIGAEAARRGLLIATVKLPLAGTPFVIDAGGRTSSLLDDTAASLLGVLRARLPAVGGIRLPASPGGAASPGAASPGTASPGTASPGRADDLDTLIERAAGRPLVLAVADAHRRAWQADLVRRVLARRPDAVVVGTGTAHDAGLAPGSYLGTRGAGRVNLEAAADVLLGRAAAGPRLWSFSAAAPTQSDLFPRARQPAGAAAGLVDRAVADGVIPGAVLAAGNARERGAEPLLLHVAGDAQRDAAARRPMTAGTVFDLASLTKVIATLPSLLYLIGGGAVGLDQPAQRYLPAFAGPGKDAVTLRHLLAHISGLPAERRYDQRLSDPGEIRSAALAEPLVAAPGSMVRYSDVGFIVLGELAAAVAGCGLDELARDVVFGPLGMASTRFLPPAAWADRIAATECVAGRAKVGVVHDENAAALGGVAGHAGLFGTAADLARYAAAWAGNDAADGLTAKGEEGRGALWGMRAEALRCHTEGLGGRRGLGWGLRGEPWDNMGDGWPVTGAGHTGFTGTSLSVDPASGLWAVLLTNAVHFGRGRERQVVALRRQVHAAVAALARPGSAARFDARSPESGR